jgi:hypothetical protein
MTSVVRSCKSMRAVLALDLSQARGGMLAGTQQLESLSCSHHSGLTLSGRFTHLMRRRQSLLVNQKLEMRFDRKIVQQFVHRLQVVSLSFW